MLDLLAKYGINGDIWIAGDNALISYFMDKGEVDEIVHNILPVTLGKGQRLKSEITTEVDWTMKAVKSFDNGVVQIVYTKKQ